MAEGAAQGARPSPPQGAAWNSGKWELRGGFLTLKGLYCKTPSPVRTVHPSIHPSFIQQTFSTCSLCGGSRAAALGEGNSLGGRLRPEQVDPEATWTRWGPVWVHGEVGSRGLLWGLQGKVRVGTLQGLGCPQPTHPGEGSWCFLPKTKTVH